MDFTVTYEQLNYYIIRHHRSFVMLDLITCLWGRRGLLRQVTLDSTLASETQRQKREVHMSRSVRIFKAVDPALNGILQD